MGDIVPIRKSVEFAGRYEKATSIQDLENLEKEIEEYLLKNPNDEESFVILMQIKYELGKYKEIVEVLEKYFSKRKEAHLKLITLYLSSLGLSGNHEKALKVIDANLSMLQDEKLKKFYLIEKAVILSNLKRLNETQNVLEKVIGKSLEKATLHDLLKAIGDLESYVDVETIVSIFNSLKTKEQAMTILEKYPYLREIYERLKKDDRFSEVSPVYYFDDYLYILRFVLKSKEKLPLKERIKIEDELVKNVPDEIFENPDVDMVLFTVS